MLPMLKQNSQRAGQWNSLITALEPGAEFAPIGRIDTKFNVKTLTISVAVNDAPITGIELWAKGDAEADFIPLSFDKLMMGIRSDGSEDVSTIPVGGSASYCLDVSLWLIVEIRAKSTGDAVVSVSAGGKA